MRFEIGKFYRFGNDGELLHILGRVKTRVYGECLVAECTDGPDLRPVGMDEVAAQNWVETDPADWDSHFPS